MKILILVGLLFHFPVFAQGNVGRTKSFLSELLQLGSPPQVGECAPRNTASNPRFTPPEHFKQVKLACQSHRSAAYQGLNLSILTLEQAKNLFDELNSIEYLPMKYLEDGCYARAHEISLIAQENGLEMGKAFLNSPESGQLLNPQSLKNQNPPRFDKNFSGWRYHATPFLLVEQPNGTIVPMVFDLGVAKGPQTFQQWKSNLHPEPQSTSLTVRHKDYVFDSGNFTSKNESIIDRLTETQNLIDEIGWSEYMFRLEQGWL